MNPRLNRVSTASKARHCCGPLIEQQQRALEAQDFPQLRLVIPHGGGAVPYHWGRFRGLADMLDRPAPEDALMRNVFFDTCVSHQPGINLFFDVIGIDSIFETSSCRVYPRLRAALTARTAPAEVG